ncbi:hypothetical protein [Endozoicomonas sp. ONNA1]|uniref:hypothetical protein n=1 Tax=Endozoicomonas sp. ONNA1 TaxID=2828740 RepID=UPI0021482278|nr:hypothetical protein [Endozoicomonas sp. ONNA1]
MKKLLVLITCLLLIGCVTVTAPEPKEENLNDRNLLGAKDMLRPLQVPPDLREYLRSHPNDQLETILLLYQNDLMAYSFYLDKQLINLSNKTGYELALDNECVLPKEPRLFEYPVFPRPPSPPPLDGNSQGEAIEAAYRRYVLDLVDHVDDIKSIVDRSVIKYNRVLQQQFNNSQ